VTVGARQRARHRDRPLAELLKAHDARQIFQIELMHDAAARRQQPDTGERLFASLQEGETLGVALELDPLIERAGIRPAAMDGDQSVITAEVDRYCRIDARRFGALKADVTRIVTRQAPQQIRKRSENGGHDISGSLEREQPSTLRIL